MKKLQAQLSVIQDALEEGRALLDRVVSKPNPPFIKMMMVVDIKFLSGEALRTTILDDTLEYISWSTNTPGLLSNELVSRGVPKGATVLLNFTQE